MPEARVAPAEWIKLINAAVSVGGINADIKTAWNELKAKTVFDGTWHNNVKERVVVPYNTITGGWAKSTTVGTKSYLGVSKLYATGSSYWVRGLLMPGGFDSILGIFDNNTSGAFKTLWQTGAGGERGSEVFEGGLVLDHRRIGIGRSTDRLWYISEKPFTCYLVSEHVDTSRAGIAELGRIKALVKKWVDDSVKPIEVGFLKMPTTTTTMYVIT